MALRGPPADSSERLTFTFAFTFLAGGGLLDAGCVAGYRFSMHVQPATAWTHGVPMPCAKCGAPMQLVASRAVYGAAALYCGYCQRNEELPPDAAERVRYLQHRLLLLKQVRENDEAPLRTIALLRRAWIPALLFLGFMAAHSLYQQFELIQSLQKTAPEAIGSLMAPLAIQMGLLGGYACGYLGMSLGYRRAVRPLLRAKPPVAQGVALRCRSCGGDLPTVRAPHVVCGYCAADNLLDSQVTQRAGDLLQQEIAAYQARAHNVYSTDAFRVPTKAFYRWGIAGAIAIAVVVGTALPLVLALLGLGK